MKKARILIIFCILYIFVNIGISCIFNIKNYDDILNSYSAYQEHCINDINNQFIHLSEEDRENPDVLNEMFSDENSYGFVYRDNIVVYEMNLETTDMYARYTTRELFNDYSQYSGSSLVDDLTNILSESEGTEFIIKNNDIGVEIITWKNVEINDKDYVIGLSTPVEKILKNTNYRLYRNVTIVFLIISNLIITVLCYYVIRLNKKWLPK